MWSSAMMIRSEATISRLPELDLDVPARPIGPADPDFAPELGRSRCDRPRRDRPGRKPDSVVVDRDEDLPDARVDADRGGIRARMERDVAGPLQHDVKRVLDEQQRPVEARPNREAGPIIEGAGLRRRLEVEQGSDVRAKVVVLPVDGRLELRQLGKGLVARSPSQQLATGRESHVDAGAGLYVLVVQ